MYSLLTQSPGGQEQQIAELIVKVAAPEKIYYLGSTLMQRRTESLFMPTAPSCHSAAHYFLLVLVEHSSQQTCSGVQDKIENNCRHILPVTALVLEVELFNQWLKQGQPFACRVVERALLLYDAGRFLLEEPRPVDWEEWERERQSIFTLGRGRVQEFRAGADLYRLRKQYKLAAFLLHQAAEQALLTLLRTGTGLRVNTHNLDKLLRYGSMVSYRLPEVLPRENHRDRSLFELLQRAYIEARYKEDYSISYLELDQLTDRVRRLQELLEEHFASTVKEGYYVNPSAGTPPEPCSFT